MNSQPKQKIRVLRAIRGSKKMKYHPKKILEKIMFILSSAAGINPRKNPVNLVNPVKKKRINPSPHPKQIA